ncbi:MAG: magnesium chelatase subunit D [Pseudomonadota bacterium]
MSETPDPWDQIRQVLRLLAVDPIGLGGLHLRARASPVRDMCLRALPDLGLRKARLHPGVSNDDLYPSMDVTATLTSGRPVFRAGAFAEPAAFTFTMAERCPADLAAKLALELDKAGRMSLIALDEGAEDDERLPPALSERVAFYLDLNGLRPVLQDALEAEPIAEARAICPEISTRAEDLATLTRVAARLGIDSLRAPLFALRAARCHAALHGRREVTQEDLEAAASLVLAHRATILPEPEAETEQQPEQPEDQPERAKQTEPTDEDLTIDAVRMTLPDGLIPQSNARLRTASGLGAGDRRQAPLRGRPLSSRRSRPDGRSRVDLIATLRLAAPWQKLRRLPGRKIIVIPSDICLKRFQTRTERLLIFVVDASGSAAHARLNEAKGAVEHLLARSYANRDRVALIGFRNQSAEILLPPNRSLLLAKHRLSALPGGGATPLAHGLQSAGELAWRAQRQGMTPTLILLTDGRANVALDGDQNRPKAMQDAESMADWLRQANVSSIVLDTAIRPQKPLAQLSDRMGAELIALPRSTAPGMTRAIETAIGT